MYVHSKKREGVQQFIHNNCSWLVCDQVREHDAVSHAAVAPSVAAALAETTAPFCQLHTGSMLCLNVRLPTWCLFISFLLMLSGLGNVAVGNGLCCFA